MTCSRLLKAACVGVAVYSTFGLASCKESMRSSAEPTFRVGLGTSCERPSVLFDVEVVNTPEGRAKGLSGRHEPLSRNRGMLFVFNPPQTANFWMKETFVPLSVGYFDSEARLTEVHEMGVEANPAQPTRSYPSADPIRFALEAAPGSFKATEPSNAWFLCVDGKAASEHAGF